MYDEDFRTISQEMSLHLLKGIPSKELIFRDALQKMTKNM